jgi:uncharacterized protein
MVVLMTGATGLVGQEIGIELVRLGHEVIVVTRNAKSVSLQLPFPCEFIEGDINQNTIHHARLKDIEAVIHLAGENISQGRWTDEKKKKIFDSRVLGTRHLLESLSKNSKLKVFVSTSAVGYYGDRQDELLTEEAGRGVGFLSDVCVAWEKEIETAQSLPEFKNVRFVVLRVGVVLSLFGGALDKMLLPFQMGVGGRLGSGKQWTSWIHIKDLVQIYATAISNVSLNGVYNATAPQSETNLEFTKVMAELMNKNSFFTVPKLVLKLALGEMSNVVLGSTRVSCEKLLNTNFKFQYSDLHEAFSNILSFYKEGYSVFTARQYLNTKKEMVFDFFRDHRNLEKITPDTLNFNTQKISTESIEEGTLIDYKLKIHGVSVHWRTLIKDWSPPEQFTDQQIKGPYVDWIHNHKFETLGPGTLMTDIVRYKLPMAQIGFAVAGAFVKGDVQKIFDFRRKAVLEFLR